MAAARGREPIARVALEQRNVVGQTMALQPADDGFELGERHLRARLAEAVAQDGVVADLPAWLQPIVCASNCN